MKLIHQLQLYAEQGKIAKLLPAGQKIHVKGRALPRVRGRHPYRSLVSLEIAVTDETVFAVHVIVVMLAVLFAVHIGVFPYTVITGTVIVLDCRTQVGAVQRLQPTRVYLTAAVNAVAVDFAETVGVQPGAHEIFVQ